MSKRDKRPALSRLPAIRGKKFSLGDRVSNRYIQNSVWANTLHNYPKEALLRRMYSIHRHNICLKALSEVPAPMETAFEKQFRKRMTHSFQVLRLVVSFFFTLMLGNLYAAIDYTKSFSIAINRIALSEQLPACIQSNNYETPGISISVTNTEKGKGLKTGLENTIYINGNVKGLPHMNNISNVKVVAVNPEDNFRVDSAYTNDSGNYNMTFLWTNNQNQNLESIVEAYPNPYSGSTNIEVISEKSQNYTLRVFNTAGQLLFQSNIELEPGKNTLTLKGGPKGVNIISLDNGINKNNYKTIELNDDNKNFNVTVTPTDFNNYFKSSNNDITEGSSLRLEFSYPNTNPRNSYQASDTTLILKLNQIIDKKLQQELITDEFSVNAYTILDGTPVLNGTALKVTWGDGTTNNYSSQNGLIHILRTSYDSTTSIHFENADTTFYQEWIFGTKTDTTITSKEKNLFQSQKELSGITGTPYIPPEPAPANLNNIPSTFEVYFVPKTVFDGENLPYETRGVDFRTVVSSRGPPFFTKKWEYVPEVTDTIYMYQMQIYNYDINQPITSEESQKMKQAMDSTVTLFTLNNGRQLMPSYKRVDIYTMTEPEWIEGVQTNGADQIHLSGYSPFNQNGCGFTYNYTMTDKPRFLNASGEFTRDSNHTFKCSELVGSLTNAHDPPQGNLGGKIVYPGGGSFTSFGKVATHLIWLTDPGTIFW